MILDIDPIYSNSKSTAIVVELKRKKNLVLGRGQFFL